MTNIAIYAGGSILNNYEPLMKSGFTTILLNSLHVHGDGSLVLNGTTLIDTSGNPTTDANTVKQLIGDLKTNGGVKTVLFSVGGGGEFPPDPEGINGNHSVSDMDYKAFTALYWAANGMTSGVSDTVPILNAFDTLLNAVGADGLDLDGEPVFYTYESFASANAVLHELTMARTGGVVSWAPYEQQPSWAALAGLLTAAGQPLPTWINLQNGWWSTAADIQNWATALGLGVGAVVPGFGSDGQPASIQSTLAGLVNGGLGIAGAYVWNYDQVGSQAASYATAIAQGLAGKSP
jgi:hypothetical protein